ncbi:MAG TPA: glycolate oxidase subunit GlcF, partial [Steroidobacteraceae bacterium]|nr:glycolate oxidase subunit GlcF [Steroidobacteraceae bacterium]
ARLRQRIPATRPAAWPERRHARHMVILEGCVQPALAPSINAAAARVMDRLGISLVRVGGERCCGALNHHLGRTGAALAEVRHNVRLLTAALDAGAEAIISTTSGCGVMVKDYAHLLRGEPAVATAAARVAGATRDVCEIIEPSMLESLAAQSEDVAVKVAWQAPCTLQHGQKITGRVEALLTAAGYRLTPVSQPHLCCGSAGTYSILQPELAQELRRRKLETLLEGQPDLIATANIGCLEHLRVASGIPVLHWIELVDQRLAPA